MDPNTQPGEDGQVVTPTPDAPASASNPTPDVTPAADATPSAPDTPSSSTDGNTAEPTTKPKEPETMAEAIAAALDGAPTEEPGAVKAEGEDGEPTETKSEDKAEADATAEGQEAADEGELPDDPTDEELATYKAKPAKRIKTLLAQRQEARREATELKPDAENYRSIRAFMKENNLADAEVADLFKAGANLKSGTPEGMRAFLTTVGPLVQQVREALGEAIPADLQSQVQTGEVTEDIARQIAQQRHAANQAAAQAELARQQAAEQATVFSQQQITQAVNDWSARKQATDPDFALKQDMMRRVAQAMVAERGRPRNADEAIQFAEATYTEATNLLKAARPAKAPTRPVPSSASPTNSGVSPAPTSLAEIVQAGLRI